MSETSEFLKIHYKKNSKGITGQVRSIEFKEDKYYIVYIPSLKLSAYGDTEEDARSMMGNIILKEFCNDLMSLSADKVISELKKLGWDQSPFFKKQLKRSASIDREGILRDFELSEDTQLTERLLAVA